MSAPKPTYADTPEKAARIGALWRAQKPDGTPLHSTKKIAVMLDISKNALVGWAGRNSDLCPTRESPIKRLYGPRKNVEPVKRAPRTTLQPLESLRSAELKIAPVKILPRAPAFHSYAPETVRLSAMRCEFILSMPVLGRGGEWCEERAVVGKIYCIEHCNLCYVRRRVASTDDAAHAGD